MYDAVLAQSVPGPEAAHGVYLYDIILLKHLLEKANPSQAASAVWGILQQANLVQV